ncbi:MAG: hypothetical protein EAX86_02100 [Candidatus Heimdallarchaeota archaeon]|nr:hypothetical protein [Candidatus Heimdallarchaeota archaeon]
MSKVLLLSRKNVEAVLNMRDTIEVLKSAFSELSNGSAILPQRIVIPVEKQKGISLYMPAFLPETGSLAVKVVTVFKENVSKFNIPTTLGKVLLQDIETGDVNCIMDGGYLTAMRTGAVSGCAIEYLAKKNAQILTLFGAGVQGSTQLWAAIEARPSLHTCRIYDIQKEIAQDFAKNAKHHNLNFEFPNSPKEAIKDTDIIVTSTTSLTPIFKGEWLESGMHISGIGSHNPGARELDTITIQRSKIICDQISACLAEAGDIMIPIKEGVISRNQLTELGEVINGLKPGRENSEEITLFKSVGLAIQDAAVAKLVYDKACEKNIGTEVEI